MSIVILVSSLLLVTFLHLYLVLQEKAHIETTKKRLEYLQVSLTDYVAMHNRLPCPASPTDPMADNSAFCAPGADDLPKGVVAARYGDHDMGRDQNSEIWIGAIPARELRLSGDQDKDGWGNKFTYAVSRRLTLPDAMDRNPVPDGIIRIVNEKHESVLKTPGTGRYVIVSHGPRGLGAWTPNGYRKECREDNLAALNCRDAGVFVIAPFSTSRGPSYYDNFVVYDGQDARGSLLNRLAFCGLKKGFYVPSDPKADSDGCVKEDEKTGLWYGACLKLESTSGTPLAAQVVFSPAQAKGQYDCTCEDGYTARKVGTWDGGAAATCNNGKLFTDQNGNSIPCETVHPEGYPGTGDGVRSTSLYTCVKESDSGHAGAGR
jgi:hypothetical protein